MLLKQQSEIGGCAATATDNQQYIIYILACTYVCICVGIKNMAATQNPTHTHT